MRKREEIEQKIREHIDQDGRLDDERLARALLHYAKIRERLKMAYSDELGLFAVDIKR